MSTHRLISKRTWLFSSLLVLVFCSLFIVQMQTSVFAQEFIAEDKPVLNSEGIYEISSPEQLLYLSQNYGSDDAPKFGYYKLMNDIDMSLITNFNPFGRFYGTFDGNYKAISNLRIDRPSSGTVGFFNHLGDSNVQAVAKNLALVDIYVSGSNTVGGLAGMLWGTVENVYVTGEVIGNAHSIGGIAGRIPADTSGTIPQPDTVEAAQPTIKNSYSIINVKQEGSGDSQGGLVGRVLNPRTTIENSYASGVINGIRRVGGLVGDLREGVVKNSVAVNPLLTAETELGTSIGRILDNASYSNIVAWDSVKKVGTAGENSVEGILKTETEMYDKATYEALGWDFDNTWEMLTVVDGEKTYRSPVLKGFEHQELTFDFESYNSSIEIRANASLIQSDSITISAEASDAENPSAVISDYSIILSEKKPTSDQTVWQKQSSKIFEGLSPSTKYTIWVKVKSEEGKESGWTSLTLYTKYETLTDKTPRNISNAITLDPKTSASFVWTTYNIELQDSTVEIVKKTNNEKISFDNAKSFKGKNKVREVHMTTNERLLDGIRNFHSVDVTGLEPGTEYMYRVGDEKEGVWSSTGSFRTAPATDDPFLFTYMTDPQGTTSSLASAATIRAVQEMFPDQSFSYFSGDMTENGYSNGQWDVFYQAAQDLFMNTPVVAALGNHDREAHMSDYINNPDTVLPYVFSFDYGPVHFVVLNTERYNGEDLDTQIDWMKEDVKSAGKKWNIVMLHKALYAATDHVDDTDINMLRVKLAPALQELEIDAVLMGHDHNFSRGFVKDGYNAKSLKLADSETDVYIQPDAPLYIVNGTMGNSKWYKKINYDHTLYNVSPDYEFIDKASSSYTSAIQEQSFTAVKVEDDSITLDTYFLKFDQNDPLSYVKKPYLYDSIKITKADYWLTASDIKHNNVKLNWASPNATSDTQYKIFQDDVLIDTVEGNSYKVTNLASDTSYNFKIEVSDGSGNWIKNGPVIKVQTDDEIKPDLTITDNVAQGIVSKEELDDAFIKAQKDKGVQRVEIQLEDVSEANVYELTLPTKFLNKSGKNKRITLSSKYGTITLQGHMLSNAKLSKVENVKLVITAENSEDNKPMIKLSVWADGKKVDYNHPGAPIEIVIP
ncbi:fibronectin type III domain-containing protein [Niallia sp. Krafla_26]|uniref:fibronectin type III domain-containing protein n=1 Tax=Niallia sp. Krafla_26 TaxID=3064703 RepID=UPI003D171509